MSASRTVTLGMCMLGLLMYVSSGPQTRGKDMKCLDDKTVNIKRKGTQIDMNMNKYPYVILLLSCAVVPPLSQTALLAERRTADLKV